jgi:hypothetical protein
VLSEARTLSARYDSEGVLWGIVLQGKNHYVAYWTEAGWQTAQVAITEDDLAPDGFDDDVAPGVYPVLFLPRLVRGPDGTVIAIPETFHEVSLQLRGTRYRWHPAVNEQRPCHIYRDASGEAWLVSGTARDFFIEGPQQYQPLMVVDQDDDEYLQHLTSALHGIGLPATSLIEDALGRFWYSFEGMADIGELNGMECLLIFDPNFSARDPISPESGAGLPHTVIYDGEKGHYLPNRENWNDPWHQGYTCFMYELSARTILMGYSYQESFQEIDTIAMIGRPLLPEDTPRSTSMASIYPAQDRLYGVASGQLWMQEHGGAWRRMEEMIDAGKNPFAFELGLLRPGLRTQKGLWIGTSGNGVVFVSKGSDTPEQFNWERGFPIATTEVIAKLPNGKLLFAGPDCTDFIVAEDELLSTPARSGDRFVLQEWEGSLIQDNGGNVWRRQNRPEYNFTRWEGEDWRSFKTPAGKDLADGSVFAFDTTNRLWSCKQYVEEIDYAFKTVGAAPPVTIFTPPDIGVTSNGKFKEYPSFDDALLSEWPVAWEGRLAEDLLTFSTMVAGPGKTFAFCNEDFLVYFDGDEWHNWTWKELMGEENPQGPRCCFDSHGTLYATRPARQSGGAWEEAQVWRLLANGSWQNMGEQGEACSPSSYRRYWHRSGREPVRDFLGTTWVQRETLYREGMGLSLPVLPEAAPSPLNAGQSLRQVFLTRDGGYFFEVQIPGKGGAQHFFLPPDPAPPETETVVGATEDGHVTLNFETPWEGPLWHTWRIDGGEWAAATQEKQVVLENLLPGARVVKVAAIAEHFVIDPTPLSLEVTAAVDTPASLKALIGQLASEVFAEREAASRALVRRGEEALPALREARKTAQAEWLWWIDSVIAAIEQTPSP